MVVWERIRDKAKSKVMVDVVGIQIGFRSV